MQSTDSESRVMIVTGGSSGIGRALAECAARNGFNVLAVGRRIERIAEVERRAIGLRGRIATLALDVRSPDAAPTIVAAAVVRFGRIDVLVNNAGGVAVGPVSAQADAALREQFETHVFAPLALVRAALPALRAARGQIFFIGSGVARIPVGGLGAYPSAKAAVRSLSRIVRNELRADEIAVTYVDPGAVDTEFMPRAGLHHAPHALLATPEMVARRIFRAVQTRARVVNAVPWQTALVALGELLPTVTDSLLAAFPQLAGGEPEPLRATPAPPAITAAPVTPPATPATFDDALAPLTRRMEKLSLRTGFVRDLLVPGARLELGEVALRWAGMPNKNERGLTHDVLESLAAAGFLEADGDDAFRVLRAADSTGGGADYQ